MRYAIDIPKLTNKLMPTYLYGRQINLLVQAMMNPLQVINDGFVVWAKNTRLEAMMTSQIILFAPFLTNKLKQYFLDPNDSITISDRKKLGIPLYLQNANVGANSDFALYHESDNQDKAPLYFENDQYNKDNYSFTVWTPAINTNKITETEYLSILKFWIDKYKVSGKTYQIKYK